MPQITANGITIEYDERGNPEHPPLLLIMGYSQQMIAWPDAFCDLIADHGFRVIRFDNRDTGFTEKFEDFGVPDFPTMLGKAAQGKPVEAPYTLEDMADDAAGLLDVLSIDGAHIVGASMGGMIAQLVAIRHPKKTLTLTSIMSSSNRPGLNQMTPAAAEALFARPASMDREGLAEHSVKTSKVIGSPGYPQDEERIKAFARMLYDRMYYPQGIPRQYAAILATPPRWERLGEITVPTLVIHGADDPLIPVDNGEDTAKLIPGAKLEIIDGMGHNLPPQLYQRLVGLLADHAHSAKEAA